jgi:FixJ family two-component response regulator
MGISNRTVEVHKARVMQKLKVDSIAQLVRLSLSVADAGRGAN